MNILRILARTFSALFAILIIAFVIGESASGGLPNFSRLPTTQLIMFVSLAVCVGGLVFAWLSENVGGWMALLGAVVFMYLDYAASGQVTLNWVIIGMGVTGLMFVISSASQPVRIRR